jgi:glycosyl transferase family 2
MSPGAMSHSWTPEKLEKQLQILNEKGDEYGFVYTWAIWKNSAREEVWRMDKTIDGLAVPNLIIENCIGTFSSVVARRSVLSRVDGLDESMRSCQDWDLFLRLNAITKICCVQEYLVSYLQNRNDKHRIFANSTSVILGHRRMLQKIERRFSDIPKTAPPTKSTTAVSLTFTLRTAISTCMSRSVPAHRDPLSPSTKNRWTASNHGSSSRTSAGTKFSPPH